jgi:hypothetical protein
MKCRRIAKLGIVSSWLVVAACASVRDPMYDGDVVIPTTSSDSATFIRITIENNRTIDAIPPAFYLTGTGRHALGIVQGMGGKLVKMIDTSWFGVDGCLTITAHYVGSGDLVFDRICWSPGYVIDVSLDNLFNPISAWAHR